MRKKVTLKFTNETSLIKTRNLTTKSPKITTTQTDTYNLA